MSPPPFTPLAALAALAIGLAMIASASLVPRTARRSFMAVFVAGAGGAYIDHGFGPLELAFALAVSFAAFRGLSSYRWIGVAWLMHTAWDIAHHLWGEPILSFDPASSAGCAVADAAFALWFFAGAPSIFGRLR